MSRAVAHWVHVISMFSHLTCARVQGTSTARTERCRKSILRWLESWAHGFLYRWSKRGRSNGGVQQVGARMNCAMLLMSLMSCDSSLFSITFSGGVPQTGSGWVEGLPVRLHARWGHAALGGRRLGPGGAIILASFLPRCKALTALNVSDNQIGAVGAQYLAVALADST